MRVSKAFLTTVRSLHDQRGALLIEALVAITVFTLLGTAVMTSVSASGAAVLSMRTNSTADTLASNQLQEILAAPYQAPPFSFTTITPPADYTVTADAVEYVVGDPNIAKIVIVVSKNGAVITTLESLRLQGA